VKTDVRDARVLSEVSARIELPSVHVPSHRAREHKALCSSREVLIKSRTQLINHCRGWLRSQARTIRSGDSSTFAVRMGALQQELPQHIRSVVQMVQQVSEQIVALDEELLELTKNDALCTRLMSVPGVGPVTALRYVAALDEVGRFADSHAVQSYLGLVPGERSSGMRKRRTSLTKAGSAEVRRVLTQAAWSAWRTRPADPMVVWARQLAERRGRLVAVIALSRKLAGILYALWRDGTRYEPSRGAQPVQAQLPPPSR
jgi:transposase